MPLPDFRKDGYLPEGIHQATEAEAVFRFGSATRRRRTLAMRLRHWVELARLVKALRFLVDGSFVTAQPNPQDVDAVVLLPPGFEQLFQQETEAALELYEILTTRRPADLFAAEDETDWLNWVDFFSRTRERDNRRKGLVEIIL